MYSAAYTGLMKELHSSGMFSFRPWAKNSLSCCSLARGRARVTEAGLSLS